MPKNKTRTSANETTHSSHRLMRDRVVGEIGTIHKDHGGRIPVALVYPNTYYIGMSSLGFQTIYKPFNEAPDVVCERAFLPDTDGQFEMPHNRAPVQPVTLEGGQPLRDYPVVAFSISYELDYFNMIRLL